MPVNENDLFAARIDEVRRVCDVINQRGLHAVIYGERGVGKTSLSNILAFRIVNEGSMPLVAPRINCESDDTFSSLWRKVFAQIDLIQQKRTPGFNYTLFQETIKAADVVPENPKPEDVRRLLTLLGEEKLIYVIFDEFDRIIDPSVRRTMADTIKVLSDNDVKATIIIIGVADDIEGLISEHESIDRCIDQIKLPRMNRAAVHELLQKGTEKLGMRITAQAHLRLALLCQGLPHYAQLLGLHSVRAALDANSLNVEVQHVNKAVGTAAAGSHYLLRNDLQKAVTSPQTVNMYRQVLTACAMAPTDEFGFFYAADVRAPLSKIMKRTLEIPYFAKHLNDFCSSERGPILQKYGEKRKFRYRFKNPLHQPLIIMKGIADKLITESQLEEEAKRMPAY